METQVQRIVPEMANMWVNVLNVFSYINDFFKNDL